MDVLIDGREMHPPEPLERTLEALDQVGADGAVVLEVHCQPQPLFNILRRNGWRWDETPLPDGAFRYRITRI